MHQDESPHQHARLKIVEAQARMDAQVVLISEMKHNGSDTKRQEIELTVLCNVLEQKRL